MLAGLGLLLFVDRMFKFSDNYITSTKIEQVEKLEKLIANEGVDSTVKEQLRAIELTVLSRQTAWDYTLQRLAAFKKVIISSGFQRVDLTGTTTPTRSFFWHTVSASWFFVLLMIVSPFMLLVEKKYIATAFISFLMVELCLLLIVFCFSALFAQIPIILGSTVITYILNAVLHAGLIGIIGSAINIARKNKASLPRKKDNTMNYQMH
jgi:hypothetical protein